MKRISVDIGGTFTDCFCVWDGRYIQAKALTTHHNLAQGFNEALDQACGTLELDREDVLSGVDSVRYATTLGTNALIERKGPVVGAIVSAGFEATIPLSRGRGYGEGLDEVAKNDLSNGTRPAPLVPQRLIRSVRERINYRGEVLMALDEDDVRRQLRKLVDVGAQAIVVCLTNAVENPEHELAVQEIFLTEYPAHQLGAIPMLLSHQLSGRKGEYVRGTSTIVDAFLHQTMYHALSELELNLRDNGYTQPMLVIHNSGGMAQLNSTDALQTIHSGPVAGIQASEHLADQAGLGNVIATLIKAEADEQMANGMAKELRTRGYLPEEFTMLAYGGNGPLHCCGIARHLGIDKVLAPPYSSVFSALGAGNMPQLHIHERTAPITLFDATTRALFADFDALNGVVAELEAKGGADLLRQGVPAESVRHRLELDMRYGNQLVTTAVVAERTRVETAGDVMALIELFAEDYARRFGAGSESPEAGIRITTIRVASYVEGEKVQFDASLPARDPSPAPAIGLRQCHFAHIDGPVDTPVFDETALEPGLVVLGPGVVTTPTTTYLVEPGWRLEKGAHGAIWFLKEQTSLETP
jgi:N-methylhydantoinase A/oxoprolinase/acetone carboxylase beta subunit